MTRDFEAPFCSACDTRIRSLFSDLKGKTLDTLDASRACNVFKKGQVIFEEGGTATGLFCIHSGKVKVYKTGDDGRDQIVRFAREGDALGYRSLMTGEAYSVSAAALEDSMICRIPQSAFFGMIDKDGKLSLRVIHLLSGELRDAEKQIVNLAQKPVRERLAEALLLLREVYGTENGEHSALNVRLTREELASVVGTATETLVRTIAELKREKLIATDKKKILILDYKGLVEASNLRD